MGSNHSPKPDSNKQTTAGASAKKNSPPAKSAAHDSAAEQVLRRVAAKVAIGHYDKALDILRSAANDPILRNARGVCHMRLGNGPEAIRVLRELVMTAGCTWMRPDAPEVYKFNFATALLIGGHPGGCLEILADLPTDHPSALKLRQALKNWERSLSIGGWLNWRFGRVAPAGCVIPLDFPPGDFGFPESMGETTSQDGGEAASADEPAPPGGPSRSPRSVA